MRTDRNRISRNRIYERLRKRSWRRHGGEYGVSVSSWNVKHHWYLKGVRDALDAVRNEGRRISVGLD